MNDPFFERVDLVTHLFEREAKRIKKSIVISNDVFSELTHQELPGNIGSLSNQVRNGLRQCITDSAKQFNIIYRIGQ